MGYQVQVPEVLAMLRAYLAAFLTAQGQAPTMIPFTDSAEQFSFADFPMPLTLIEVGETRFQESGEGIAALPICQVATVHYVTERSASGSALVEALTLVRQLIAEIRADWTMGGNLQKAHAKSILTGKGNPLQQFLLMNSLTPSIVAISVPLELEWVEAEA